MAAAAHLQGQLGAPQLLWHLVDQGQQVRVAAAVPRQVAAGRQLHEPGPGAGVSQRLQAPACAPIPASQVGGGHAVDRTASRLHPCHQLVWPCFCVRGCSTGWPAAPPMPA